MRERLGGGDDAVRRDPCAGVVKHSSVGMLAWVYRRQPLPLRSAAARPEMVVGEADGEIGRALSSEWKRRAW